MTASDLTRILHVDDDPDIREVAKLALETLGGYTVESCESGDAAVAKMPVFHPDIILLDVMMPGMSGPRTLKEIRSLPEGVATPVVFMTAKVQAEEIEALKESGAVDVIEKPFDPMEVSDRVQSIWRTHADRS